MPETDHILELCVRQSVDARRSKKIGYEKLLPYTIKTLQYLIACAQAGGLTTYKEVSAEIGAGSPQNANWAFGTIFRILEALERNPKFSGCRIPNITAIVKKSGMEASGIGVYRQPNLEHKPKEDQDRWLANERKESFTFKRWDEVLSYLRIEPMEDLVPEKALLQSFELASRKQTGKSAEHQAIQDRLEQGLPEAGIKSKDILSVEQEYPFWSLDRLDVLIKTANEWIGVEVKPSTSSEDELRKGLYQVIKYKALLDAELLAEGLPQTSRCILVTGGVFPRSLDALKRRFKIHVVDNFLQKMTGE